MKTQIRLWKRLMLLVLVLMGMIMVPMKARAEMLEVDFIYHTGGDLAFSFFYESEVPDLIFVSPSGVEYAEGISTESELIIGRGEGWSTYRIPDAEVGQWRLLYDKKSNATIDYVQVKPIEAIAIQSFTLTGIEGNVINATFDVRKGEENASYSYRVDLVDGEGKTVQQELTWGWAETMAEQSVSVSINASTGKDYRLVLHVTCDDDGGSFDYQESEPFDYTNPNTPAAVTDFVVKFDGGRSRCTMDWSEYAPGGYGTTYNVVAYANDDRENPIYFIEGESETSISFLCPTDTTKLEIELSYVRDGIASETKTKTIHLSDAEYLRIAAEDVVSDALLPLEYSVKKQTELYVTLNGVEGAYAVNGEDVLYLTLQSGSNTVEATFVGADNLVYSVSKEIFYTWSSPSILLFENLDGMTFKRNTVPLSGLAENATEVTVNGVKAELAEDGSFYCEVPIAEGENSITVEAISASGLSSVKKITVIGKDIDSVPVGALEEQDGTKNEEGGIKALFKKWTSSKWFATVVAVIVSVLVLIFFFATLRDKKKKSIAVRLRNALICFGLLEVALGVAYFFLWRFNNSMEYVELVQESVQRAALFLRLETYGKYLLVGLGVVVLLLIIGLIGAIGIKEIKGETDKVDKPGMRS